MKSKFRQGGQWALGMAIITFGFTGCDKENTLITHYESALSNQPLQEANARDLMKCACLELEMCHHTAVEV